jgi:hypothetical protein
MRDVVLHAFSMSYSSIANRAGEIVDCGYGAAPSPEPLNCDEDNGRA